MQRCPCAGARRFDTAAPAGSAAVRAAAAATAAARAPVAAALCCQRLEAVAEAEDDTGASRALLNVGDARCASVQPLAVVRDGLQLSREFDSETPFVLSTLRYLQEKRSSEGENITMMTERALQRS